MTTINPRLAALAAELYSDTQSVIESYFDHHADELRGFEFVRVELHTADGRTAVFYEDGIEFYPKPEKQDVAT